MEKLLKNKTNNMLVSIDSLAQRLYDVMNIVIQKGLINGLIEIVNHPTYLQHPVEKEVLKYIDKEITPKEGNYKEKSILELMTQKEKDNYFEKENKENKQNFYDFMENSLKENGITDPVEQEILRKGLTIIYLGDNPSNFLDYIKKIGMKLRNIEKISTRSNQITKEIKENRISIKKQDYSRFHNKKRNQKQNFLQDNL